MPSSDVLRNRDPAGPDFPGRRAAERALGAAMVAILGLGLWQAVAAINKPAAQLRLGPTLTFENVLAGRAAAAVNHVMAQDLPADGLFRAAGGVLRWTLFGSGGPQVWPGCDNWLFLTEELRPWPDGDAAMAERAAMLARLAERLAGHGIALRVAVVPDKARMLADARCGAPYSAESQRRLAAFGALIAPQIQAVDLPPLFRERAAALYYRTDSHWNQNGARLAAAAIAAAAPAELARTTTFQTEATAERERAGDLLRLMSLDAVPNALRPLPDRERTETTSAPEAPEADSILDEAPVPEVVLVGSSFSLNANFHGALQQALSAPVANLSKAGGGFAGAASAFFGSPAWRETPPKLVVWEFPERVLNQPINDDDRALAAWLAQPEAR